MPERIGDLRTNIATIEDATAIMAEIGKLSGKLAYREAKAQVKINKLLADLESEISTDRENLVHLKEALAGFISGNRHLFRKPRKVKTNFGQFGLQDVCEVDVLEEEKAIAWLMRQDHGDLFKVTTSLVKPAIRKAIEEGMKIPGIQLKTGDTIVVNPAKSIIDAERERANQET